MEVVGWLILLRGGRSDLSIIAPGRCGCENAWYR